MRPDLPGGWVDTILAALSTEPDARPPSARAFAAQLIEATASGASIVQAVCPRFFRRADADDKTVRQLAPATPSAARPTVALKPQSTISQTAGQQQPSASINSPRRWPLAVAGVAVLGVVGVVVAVILNGRGETSPQAAPAAEVAVTPTLDASPSLSPQPGVSASVPADAAVKAQAMTVVRVETTPPGATVRHGETTDGPTPVDIELPVGSQVELAVELEGYQSESKRVTAGAKPSVVDLTLTPLRSRRQHHRHARVRSHAEKEPKTPAASDTKASPAKSPPKHFDPDAPGG